ncbi:hypothetical protein ACFVZ3_22735 [Kitasatospora purpeofusca]|uniref:hypothetical protein n=1 Tax=Kitasatospora purpeofusca TaxID=67352 RepID=UPI0036537B0B
MRTSIMPASAKNTVVRRRVAAVAATVLLAGSVQLLTAESSWACGGPNQADVPGATSASAQAAAHHGQITSAFVAPSGSTVTPGGKVEVGTQVANFTGADFRTAVPGLSVGAKGARLRAEDVTVEALVGGVWKKLGTQNGCGADNEAVVVDSDPLAQPLKDGRAARTIFRISLSAKAPTALTELSLNLSAWSEDDVSRLQNTRTVKIVRSATKPTAPAGAATSVPAAKESPAKPAAPAAKPAADAAPAKETAKPAPAAPVAPKSTPSAAPATTAPAGTPELAQTGADTPNGLLAGIAAGVAALGAGMVLTVRRLRARR